MTLELLYILIKSACANGKVSDDEYNHILKEAKRIGVSKENIDFLIKTELENVSVQKKVDSDKNKQSGFITNNNFNSGFITTENHKQSGFITGDDSQSGFIANKGSELYRDKKFTDIKTLNNQGAMSVVQKAKYFGKWVIIKRIKPKFKNNKNYIELFNKEFENAYHLDHVNIARIFGKEQDKNGLFYFMEYVDGRTLTKLIKENNGIKSGKLIKKLAVEILEALDYVHKKQIFHRDLKPDNILISYKGDNVKIIDFGLALSDSYDDALKTVGTPQYMAPEQKNIGYDIDQRADIYSFGVIFLEMLTGQTNNLEKAKERSEKLYEIIKKCTQDDRIKRYNSCREIIYQIENININDKGELDENKLTVKQKSAIKEDNILQNVYSFFKYTHKKWLRGDLNFIKTDLINEQSHKKYAEQHNAYTALLQLCTNNFVKAFKNKVFIKNEYLVKQDNLIYILTNYRLFIRNSSKYKFNVIPLSDIDPEKEKVQPIDYLYVNFRNYRIWITVWELILQLIKKEEWLKIPKEAKALIKSDAELISNEQKEYIFNENQIYHTTTELLFDNTHQIWESSKFIQFYNNRFLDHTHSIQKHKFVTNNIFNQFYPLKNEFILLDCLHQQGLITSFRIFYLLDNSDYKVVSIFDIEEYTWYDSGIFVHDRGIEIKLKSKQSIKIAAKMEQKSEFLAQKNTFKRINLIIKFLQSNIIPSEIKQLIHLNKSETKTYLGF